MNSVTTLLAGWGAIISTAVLAWEVYKWRKTRQVQLSIRANGNFQDAHSHNPRKYVSITVTNNGDRPTTLGLITFRCCDSEFSKRKKNQPEQRGFFRDLKNQTSPLPHKLEVGAEWKCVVDQTPEIEKMARDGYLYVEAEDSSTSNSLRFARCRLVLNNGAP